jgi:hypothetical protein
VGGLLVTYLCVLFDTISLRNNTLVAELIDQENGRWNGTLIEANFIKEEAKVIKKKYTFEPFFAQGQVDLERHQKWSLHG